MKLKHLVIQNAGAFNNITEIDFSKLGEIFLISGNTGSGKTTIFDAVTFALYGKLPGSRSSLELRRFRSDFARDEEDAFVILQFTINQDVYKIYRSLPQPYTKRDGTKGYKNSNAVLYIRQSPAPNGEFNFSNEEQWNILSDSMEDIKSKVEQLLGLNSDEFTRIVLLPQGEFADFLKLSSSDRKEALSKLFPIDLYTSIMETAKEKSSQYKIKIDSLENRIKDLRSEYNEKQSALLEESIRKDMLHLKRNKNTLNEQISNAAEHRQKNEILCKEIEARIENEKKMALLVDQKEEIEKISLKIMTAKQALSLQSEIKNVRQSQHILEDTEKRTRQIAGQLEDAQNRFIELQNKKTDAVKLEDDIKAFSFALKDITEAQEAAAEYSNNIAQRDAEKILLKNNTDTLAAMEKEIQECKQKEAALSDLTAKYNDSVNNTFKLETSLQEAKEVFNLCLMRDKLHNDIEQFHAVIIKLNSEIDSLEKNLATANITLSDFEHEKEHNLIINQASILAQKLEDGKPCPVCGSLEHPVKAVRIEHTVPLEDKIATQKKIIETAGRELQNKYSDLANQKGQLKAAEDRLALIETDITSHEAEKTKDSIQSKLDSAKKSTADLMQEIKMQEENTRKLEELEKKYKPLQEELYQLKNTLTLIEQDIERNIKLFEKKTELHKNTLKELSLSDKNFSITAFSNRITARLKELLQSCEQQVSAFKENFQKTEQLLTSLSAQKQELENTLSLRRSEAQENMQLLKKALSKTKFGTVDEARSAFMEESDVIALEEKVHTWNKEKDALSALISSSIEKYPQSLLEAGTAAEEYELAVKKYKNELAEIERDLEKKNAELTTLEHKKGQLTSYDKELLLLQAEGEKYIKLHLLLSSQNPKKIPFDAWVLGLYLEEITQHASKRLNRISDGRYTLLLKTEEGGGRDKIKGLDLEIFDSFTGKKRPCATLSGGETFMASISLALALTDVVQSKAGGVSLDSLFIDEGFGSLDDASLEKALSILDEIRGKRMVGLISHVGDLKSRISSQILVRKGQNGSSITIST